MSEKNCTKCGELKPLTDFHKNKRHKDLHQYECKACNAIPTNRYRHTRDGLITAIYSGQKNSSRQRNHEPPSYGKTELSIWVKSQRNFEALYINWINSGFNTWKRPSVDRENDYLPYTISNLLRICTRKENCSRASEDMKAGINNKNSISVNQLTLNGEFIKEHYSMRSAARKTKTLSGDVCNCCKGKRETAGGFKWEYA